MSVHFFIVIVCYNATILLSRQNLRFYLEYLGTETMFPSRRTGRLSLRKTGAALLS